MIILSNKNSDDVIVVQKKHCNLVSSETLKKYLSAYPDEDCYYVSDVSKIKSTEILNAMDSGSTVKIRRSNISSLDIYYKPSQNQIIIVDDMKGLIFNSSNDIKKHSDLIDNYGSLSEKFKKMIELGYLEKLNHDDFIKTSNDLKGNNTEEDSIIIEKPVSDYIDDLQDSGETGPSATTIDL